MLIDLRAADGFGEFRNQYLYSYIYRFIHRSKVEIKDDDIIMIPPEKKELLVGYFEEALECLLTDLYEDPSSKEYQRKRIRFKKFTFKCKTYKVNYKTSGHGRLMWSVHEILNALKNVPQEDHIELISG